MHDDIKSWWGKDPFKVQDKSTELNITEQPKFTDIILDSHNVTNLSKQVLHKQWYSIKEEYL